VNARLIYAVGPSGAGKDSLLVWLSNHLPRSANIHFARRCITREAQADGERHESVDAATFNRLHAENAFALQWQANNLLYGVRHSELAPLQDGVSVIVNGSRAHLPIAISQFPNLIALHITASVDILRSRLLARARETPEAIESRIHRSTSLQIPANIATIEIRNDDSLDVAGQALLNALQQQMNWSSD
jgi:ribose 1,5-bisphosphokinase